MTVIKPISALRNHTKEITNLCHEHDEPVYLTINGEGDLVIMTIDHYEKLKEQIDLFKKLSVAQEQSLNKDKRITHKEVIKKMEQYLINHDK